MKDLGKRLLSLAIVLLMVLSMIPAQPIHVHATDITAEAGNLATAISNANAGDEVKL